MCAVIAIGIGNSNDLTSIVVLAIGLPIACAMGVFICDRRFKYICNPKLVDGFVTSEEILTSEPKAHKKKAVKWEQPKVNKLLKNELFNRLLYVPSLLPPVSLLINCLGSPQMSR